MVGCLGVGLLAAVASAQSPLTEVWERLERYGNLEFSHDQPIDMVVWADEEDPEDVKHWVFVTGYMTNLYGGKFIATYCYDEANPNSNVQFDYWPSTFATTTVEHKAVAMAFHPGDTPPEDFRLYVTGVTEDGEGDQNVVVIKYLKNLTLDTASEQAWTSPDGYRIYDRGDGSDDVPVDVLVGEGEAETHVVILATTLIGTGEEDITTIWYDAEDGDFLDSDDYDGPGSGVDIAAEGALATVPPQATDGPVVIVSGTSYGGASTHDDFVAIMYTDAGTRATQWSNINSWGTGVRRYDGPDGDNELCTGISHLPQRQDIGASRAVLIGRTPRYPAYTGDTEYLLYSINPGDGSPFWEDDGYGDGARVTGPAADHFQDTARDAVTVGDQVFVTGELGTTATRWRVGTFALGLSDPEDGVEESGEWFFDEDDSDNRGLAITSDEVGATVYVAGWCASFPQNVPARYMTLRYESDDLSAPTDEAFNSYDIDDRAAAVWWHGYADPVFGGLFVTGSSAQGVYFYDWGTIEYTP